MRALLPDHAIRVLATLMFLLAPLPPAALAVQAGDGLLLRELAAAALPSQQQAVLRDDSPTVHLVSDRRRERGQPRRLLVAAFAAAVLATLALRAVPGMRPAARRPRHRDRRALTGPRAPPGLQRA